MTIHKTHLYGFNYETTYGNYYSGADPAAGDTFYLLGNWKGQGTFPTIGTQASIKQSTAFSNLYTDHYVNQRLPQGQIQIVPVNGIPDYVLLGGESTAADVHTLTPDSSQPSLTLHFEETGGDTDIIRYVTGVVFKSIEYSIDFNDQRLVQKINVVGKKEYNHNATADAVALTNAPSNPSGSKTEEVRCQGSSAYVKYAGIGGDNVAAFKSITWKWDNQLNPPIFTNDDSDGFPQHAGPKRKGGRGTGQIVAYLEEDTFSDDVLTDTTNDVTVKVVGKSDPSQHYATYTLSNAQVTDFNVVHKVGENILATLPFVFGDYSIDWLDGITDEATYYP